MALSQWGVCTNFLGNDAYSLHTDAFSALAERFSYIELPAMTVAELGKTEFSALTAAAAACSAGFPVMTNFFSAQFPLLSPGLDRGALTAYLERLLPRCEALGCKALVLGSGKARSLQSGQSREDGYRVLAQLLNNTVLPLCQKYGVSIIIEPLNPKLTDFMLDLWEGRELARRCEGEVSLLADSLHLMSHPEIERELEENRQWITHVHLSEADRAAPGKPLSPQMARFLNALRAVGYEGPASFECHMEDPSVMEAAREAVAEALGA